mmetsp:Transcript_29209/g.93840  ORF Transcript_29209/g.93840 Transcript_29209/m.93840 type:complete len:222 (+) Transcript_29209:547-1212(+)
MALPSAKERAIERSTGPLTAAHASERSMQPSRISTHSAERAVGTRSGGEAAATHIVPVRTPRVSHSRATPRGGAATADGAEDGAACGARGALFPSGSSEPPAATMYAAPAAALTSPTGVMPSMPIGEVGSCLRAASAATRLVDEPMRVMVPPSIVAKERGIISCLGATAGEREAAHERATGMSIAQTGVLFSTAESSIVGSTRRSTAARRDEGRPRRKREM